MPADAGAGSARTSREVAVLGAGPVGCTLALALQRAGRPVVLVGGGAERAPAFRPIALSYASRLMLERVGAWGALAATPIEAIHVSQAGAFGRTCLAAAEAGLEALGHVVDYGALAAALLARVEACGVARAAERGDAALIVHAEGASPDARAKDYGQEAVLALVEVRPAAARTAYERFTAEGPLALLPFAGRYALVWASRPARAPALLAAPPEAFLAELERAFGRRAGEFLSVSERTSVRLALRVRRARVGERAAWIGNAAQTLHPVAGQGLNLGLRDAWDLARLIEDAEDPGEARLLARYAARRRLDAAATIAVTDFLAGAPAGALAAAARAALLGAGMSALEVCTPLRRFFARRMIYGTAAIP